MDSTDGSPALFLIWLLMGILSLVMNISCLIVLYHCTELDDVTKVFLTSLNAADLGLCLSFIIPSIATALLGELPFSEDLIWCFIQVLTMQPCIFAVVLSVIGVNIERYIAICYPLRYPRWVTPKRAKLTVACIWFVGVFVIIMCGIESEWHITYLHNHQMCFFDLEHDEGKATWMVWYSLSLSSLSIGIIIVLILYILILRVVRNRTVEDRFLGRVIDRRKKDCRSLTTFSLLTLSLVLGYMPYLLACYFEGIGEPWPYKILLFVRLCFASNGWLDVLIYYGRNKALRRSAIRLFSKYLCCNRFGNRINRVDNLSRHESSSTR